MPTQYSAAMTSRGRRTGYQFNLTGRSVKGGGGLGRSTSPASHSGMDPNLPRGKSSQLDFEMVATESQIKSISKSFQKLRDIRLTKQPTAKIYSAY